MQSSLSHVAAVLVAGMLWGTTGTVAHHAPPGSDPMLIGLSTFGFGGLILMSTRPRRTLALLRERRALPLLAVGAVGVLGYACFYYWSLDLIGVAAGDALALASGPVWAGVLEMVVDRRPPGWVWLGVVSVPVAGICLLVSSGGSAPASRPVAGAVLGLAAGFGWALYSWAGSRLIVDPGAGGNGTGGRDSGTVMAAMFTLASVVLVPWFLLAGPGPLIGAGGLPVLAYLAVVPMALGYTLFGFGLRRVPASAATTLALTEPLTATLLATSILGEKLTGTGWIGLSLVGAGIVLSAISQGRSVARRRSASGRRRIRDLSRSGR
ncbi:EamA/RhaT family transporter [Acidipropionibacterium jensenii]|uniref:DMT family transporter n=7 Tax=Acidipropionibacterium jensenii TaxID=1749 RepID=UPI00110A1C40|nr:EamA family transporter [Acidipropionibacterium jensenii]QCV88174.1 EamA/RhaT family transporter [Acidipropionibacterium jensenii]